MKKKPIPLIVFILIGGFVGLIIHISPLLFEMDIFRQLTLKESGRYQPEYIFEYDCQEYNFSLLLYQSYYEHFQSSKKQVFSLSDMDENEFLDKYYGIFLSNKIDEKILDEIIQIIQEEISSEDSDNVVLAIVSFVQNFEYNCEKANSYELFNLDPYYDLEYNTNYPYETLYHSIGVCEDTSILLAKLLIKLGYGVALLYFEDEKHMSVGLACADEYSNYESGYCYIETTLPSQIGIVPYIANEIEIKSTPNIIEIAEGKTFNKITQIKKQQEELSNEYGPDILQLAKCQEIELLKEIIQLEKELEPFTTKLMKYEERINKSENKVDYQESILDSYDDQYKEIGIMDTDYQWSLYEYDSACFYIITDEQYAQCTKLYNKAEDKRQALNSEIDDFNSGYYTAYEEYNTTLNEYNNLIDEYNEFTEAYNTQIEPYNEKIEIYNNLLLESYKECSPVKYEPEEQTTVITVHPIEPSIVISEVNSY
ncbi:MAG: hypothetical protein KJ709_08610 [Nanoarchaeota archaeon]|nr:hypothetical protein [Nanoarchaeota archaeon]